MSGDVWTVLRAVDLPAKVGRDEKAWRKHLRDEEKRRKRAEAAQAAFIQRIKDEAAERSREEDERWRQMYPEDDCCPCCGCC